MHLERLVPARLSERDAFDSIRLLSRVRKRRVDLVEGANGSPVALTRGFSPTFSPDRTTIAFLRDPRDPHYDGDGDPFLLQAWLIHTDGSGLRKLGQQHECCLGFSSDIYWSPDGSSVVLTGGPHEQRLDVGHRRIAARCCRRLDSPPAHGGADAGRNRCGRPRPSVLKGRLFNIRSRCGARTDPVLQRELVQTDIRQAERRVHGIGRGVRPLTFVLARREWDGRWQDFAMSTISLALRERGHPGCASCDGIGPLGEHPSSGAVRSKPRASRPSGHGGSRHR